MSKKETKTEKPAHEKTVTVPDHLHERVVQLLKAVGTTAHGPLGHDARALLEELL